MTKTANPNDRLKKELHEFVEDIDSLEPTLSEKFEEAMQYFIHQKEVLESLEEMTPHDRARYRKISGILDRSENYIAAMQGSYSIVRAVSKALMLPTVGLAKKVLNVGDSDIVESKQLMGSIYNDMKNDQIFVKQYNDAALSDEFRRAESIRDASEMIGKDLSVLACKQSVATEKNNAALLEESLRNRHNELKVLYRSACLRLNSLSQNGFLTDEDEARMERYKQLKVKNENRPSTSLLMRPIYKLRNVMVGKFSNKPTVKANIILGSAVVSLIASQPVLAAALASAYLVPSVIPKQPNEIAQMRANLSGKVGTPGFAMEAMINLEKEIVERLGKEIDIAIEANRESAFIRADENFRVKGIVKEYIDLGDPNSLSQILELARNRDKEVDSPSLG